jgi:hypothetical protein
MIVGQNKAETMIEQLEGPRLSDRQDHVCLVG